MSSENDENANGPDSGKGGKKKGTQRVLLGLVVVAAAVGSYFLFTNNGTESTDDAAVKGDQIVVSAQSLGQIVKMAAEEQDPVTRNEVLVRLDDLSLKAQESQAAASKELADQNVVLSQEKLDQAQTDFNRAVVQLKSKIIPQEQYDHLQTAFSAAQTQFKIAQAQVKLAEAQLATVQTNLTHTVLSSPIDGIVAKKWSMPGNIVQPAQPIYTLYDLGSLWIEANFKETQVKNIRPGDRATISVDAFSGRKFSGKVTSIGSATASEFALIPPDNSTGNFTKVTQRVPVKITLDRGADVPDPKSGGGAAPEQLVPGMSAEVRITIGAR